MMKTTNKTYSGHDMVSAMPKISDVVKSLTDENFRVNKVIISNGGRPTIILFHSQECQELINKGLAWHQHLQNGTPFKYGVFERGGCKVIWSESLF